MGEHGEDGTKTLFQCEQKGVEERKKVKDFAGVKQKANETDKHIGKIKREDEANNKL